MDLQNYHEWIAERQRLLERIKDLEAENAELRKRLGEDVVPIKQEPAGRTITVAYLAIIDDPIAVTGQDDAAKAEWWPLSDLPHLAFDHYDIMQDAIVLYRAKC